MLAEGAEGCERFKCANPHSPLTLGWKGSCGLTAHQHMGLSPDTLRQALKTEPQSPLINTQTDTQAGQPQTHRHWQIFLWSDRHRGEKPYRGMPAYTEAWACVGQLRHINVPIPSATDTPTSTGQAVGLRLRSFLDIHTRATFAAVKTPACTGQGWTRGA